MYEAVIVFTLDTICPWTFLAKKRLDEALAKVRASQASPDVTFTVRYDSFQLHPDLPQTVDKQEWYLRNMHMDNTDAQKLYQAHMSDQFTPLGITLNFDGTIGNTFQAHRVIQYFQEEKGPETASRLVDGLFMRYLTEAKNPTNEETLVESCVEAGIDREGATAVVRDQSKKEAEVKRGMRDVARDIDSVPSVRFEGRRRDITIRGPRKCLITSRPWRRSSRTVLKQVFLRQRTVFQFQECRGCSCVSGYSRIRTQVNVGYMKRRE
uniref:DSBA-like thioredoxin domain-containing protein n=1 Tax=Bionectria ochroleuca TaxID=29856 RepID=A0A8H7NFX5_BIOOC